MKTVVPAVDLFKEEAMSSNSLVTTNDLNLPIAHMRSVFHADEVQRKLVKLQSSGAEREHESLRDVIRTQRMRLWAAEERCIGHARVQAGDPATRITKLGPQVVCVAANEPLGR